MGAVENEEVYPENWDDVSKLFSAMTVTAITAYGPQLVIAAIMQEYARWNSILMEEEFGLREGEANRVADEIVDGITEVVARIQERYDLTSIKGRKFDAALKKWMQGDD